MTVDSTKLDNATVEDVVRELRSCDGPTTTITTNILRNWSREKIRRFASHLLGEPHDVRKAFEKHWQRLTDAGTNDQQKGEG